MAKQARKEDMDAKQPNSPKGIDRMNVADKEWRVEHITGSFSRNDAVVDAVPFVYGISIVAGPANQVGIDRHVRICEPHFTHN